MNLRRSSFLATTALCAIAFLFGSQRATSALGDTPWTHIYTAGQAPVIGTLFSKGKLELNRRSVSNSVAQRGLPFRNCTLVRTFDKPVTIKLNRGGYVLIKPNSVVQVCDHDGQPVRLTTTIGGGEVRYLDNRRPDAWLNDVKGWLADSGITGAELPGYLSSLGVASVFPSIGGGGSSYPNP